MRSKEKSKDNWVSSTTILGDSEKRNASVPRLKLGSKIMETSDTFGGTQMNSTKH